MSLELTDLANMILAVHSSEPENLRKRLLRNASLMDEEVVRAEDMWRDPKSMRTFMSGIAGVEVKEEKAEAK